MRSFAGALPELAFDLSLELRATGRLGLRFSQRTFHWRSLLPASLFRLLRTASFSLLFEIPPDPVRFVGLFASANFGIELSAMLMRGFSDAGLDLAIDAYP